MTEQLSPDYDYEKLKENYKDTLLGNYIEEMESGRRMWSQKRHWNMESMRY